MPSTPMARVTDPVTHPLPPMLTPGPGSTNVIVGFLPAWRGLPAAQAAILQAAKQVSDTVIMAAETATKAAAGTPAAPAAIAAENAAKVAATSALSSLMNSLGASAGAAGMSGGMVDIHMCATPSPVPPHGPGMVIDGNPTVLVNGLPATQMGDKVLEAIGPPNPIVNGCTTVIIGEMGGGPSAPSFGDMLGAAVDAALNTVSTAAATAMAVAAAAVTAVVAGVQSLASQVIDGIRSGAQRIAETVGQTVDRAVEFVRETADAVVDGVRQVGEAISEALDPRDQSVRDEFHTQEQSNSCVVATSRNMIQYYTGEDVPESELRDDMRDIMNRPNHNFETTPISPAHAEELLEQHGVDADVRRNQSLEDLEAEVADGDPVMIGFRNPGHRVALSGVETDADGNRTFIVMDPAGAYNGEPRRMTEAQFQNRYNPNAIVIVPE